MNRGTTSDEISELLAHWRAESARRVEAERDVGSLMLELNRSKREQAYLREALSDMTRERDKLHAELLRYRAAYSGR